MPDADHTMVWTVAPSYIMGFTREMPRKSNKIT
jgi:hypothetical protein